MYSDKGTDALPNNLDNSWLPCVYLYLGGGASNLGFFLSQLVSNDFVSTGTFSNEGQPDAFQIIYTKHEFIYKKCWFCFTQWRSCPRIERMISV